MTRFTHVFWRATQPLRSFGFTAVLAGTMALAANARAGEVDLAMQAEQKSARRENLRRQVQAKLDRERSDLVAFGCGTTSGSVRITVRKHLRTLGAQADVARLLAETVAAVPPGDLRFHDGLLASVRDDGRLPPPPVAQASGASSKWRVRLEAGWGDCARRLIEGELPDETRLRELRDDLELWRRTESTPADTKRQVALQGHFRNVVALLDLLADTRRAEKLRARLTGFSGGTLAQLVDWLLQYDASIRFGTPTQDPLSRLSAKMVSQFARNRDQGAEEWPGPVFLEDDGTSGNRLTPWKPARSPENIEPERPADEIPVPRRDPSSLTPMPDSSRSKSERPAGVQSAHAQP